MSRPINFLLFVALLAGSTGCAGTALREVGSPIFGPRAWNTPPAPPQRPVKLAADTTALPTDHPSLRQRLAGSLASLTKKPSLPAPVASAETSRPSWFGLRSPKPATPTTYITDARKQPDRPGQIPTTLPVALQVPSTSTTADRMVTPTAAQADKAPPSVTQGVVIGAETSTIPDFGGQPSAPGEDEVNPLPPAAEPGTRAAIVNQMPEVPAVDPLADGTTTYSRDRKPGSPDSDESTVLVSAVPDDASPQTGVTKPAAPATQLVETSGQTAPTASKQTVLASPQQAPPVPTSQAKTSPHVKPSPQGAAGPEQTWRRPCLRRLVRKACHLGEFADPPTAAPH